VPISVSDTDRELDPRELIQDSPVLLSGAGDLKTSPGEVLRVADLIVAPRAEIVATALVVESFLDLQGDCSLQAADDSKITLREDVSLIFTADTIAETPVLRLGNIGTDYDVVPRQLAVNLSTQSGASLAAPRLLVSGKTLDNCPKWKELLDPTLPGGLVGACRDVPAAASGRRLQDEPAAPKEVGLYVETQAKPPTKKSDTVVIVVVVVVVVVVVIGVAVGIFLFLRNKGSAASSSSPDSISA
jgi:hypothetical protein